MIRNRELKSIIIKIIILGLVFLLLGTLGINLLLNNIKKDLLERDFAIVGRLIEDYPDSQEEIVSNISKDPSKEDIDRGRSLMEGYGYREDINISLQPLLRENRKLIFSSYLVFLSSFLLAALSLIFLEYKKIYKNIQELSKVSEGVMEGDFSRHLEESDEGDFYILNHHFNQMSGRLKNNLDILQDEKVFLKDTISNISHQLKTPLSSLKLLNDILLDDLDMEEDLRRDFLEKTDLQVRRMEWLILNLLKLARIEAGSIEFKKEKVYLKDVVNISINTLKPLLKETSVSIDGNLDAAFTGDLDWSVEAAINIIKNAIEHGRGELFISLEESPLFSSITIRDNGRGIEKSELGNIFKRFYKGENNVRPESIGIGLNLAKLIVESQDGTIAVSETGPQGTEFTIRFLKNRA